MSENTALSSKHFINKEISSDRKNYLEEEAKKIIDAIPATVQSDGNLSRISDAIRGLGEETIKSSVDDTMVSDLLDKTLGQANDDSEVSKNLKTLHEQVNEITLNRKISNSKGVGRLVMNFAPTRFVAKKITNWKTRNEPQYKNIKDLSDTFTEEIKAAEIYRKELENEQGRIRDFLNKTDEHVYFLETLQKQTDNYIEVLENSGDERNKKYALLIKQNLANEIIERNSIFHEIMSRKILGYEAIEMAKETNKSLIRELKRTQAITVPVLGTYIQTSNAVTAQQSALNFAKSARKTTNDLQNNIIDLMGKNLNSLKELGDSKYTVEDLITQSNKLSDMSRDYIAYSNESADRNKKAIEQFKKFKEQTIDSINKNQNIKDGIRVAQELISNNDNKSNETESSNQFKIDI